MTASKERLHKLAADRRTGWLAFALGHVLVIGLAVLSALAADWHAERGHRLYYGDAEAHLNIARRVFDSRTPDGEQIGTVWLPAPHAAMLKWVRNDADWRTGRAGAIPAQLAFIAAALLIFDLTRRWARSVEAAFTAAALFALNPNLLYLQSTPMTEPLFLAALLGMAHALVWHSKGGGWWAVAAGSAASAVASLSRYEGWAAIPLVAVLFWVTPRGNWKKALAFSAFAALAPAAWLLHNYWYWGDPLEFFRGPWSAMAIYKRQLASGMSPYPGDHDWPQAARYYATACALVLGTPLAWLGLAGAIGAAFRRGWVALLLALPPVFYVWSMHSSGTPIFVPSLFPHSYYNTRYALAALPLAAFGGGVLVSLVPRRARAWIAAAVVLTASAPWLASRNREAWICWKESQVNSEARRAWTRETARFLKDNYSKGEGVFMPFGDLTGVLREAGIPLRESLHEGNHPAFDAAMARPDLFLHEEWALAFSGDAVATALLKAGRRGRVYRCVFRVSAHGGPVVEVYRRDAVPPAAPPLIAEPPPDEKTTAARIAEAEK